MVNAYQDGQRIARIGMALAAVAMIAALALAASMHRFGEDLLTLRVQGLDVDRRAIERPVSAPAPGILQVVTRFAGCCKHCNARVFLDVVPEARPVSIVADRDGCEHLGMFAARESSHVRDL